MIGCISTKLDEKRIYLITIGLLFTVFFISGLGMASSTISVESSASSLDAGEQAQISIRLIPDTAVKSFEFSLEYDEDLLTVSQPQIGSFFDGFTCFTSNGTIDNNNGIINHVYSLIIGEGNVSDEDILYSFTVTASEIIGSQSAMIRLIDVGITNSTDYLPLDIENLSIRVNTSYHGPYLFNPQPSNQTSQVSVDLSALQMYLFHTDGSPFNYSVTTNPNIGSIQGNLTENNTISLSLSSLAYETSYHWTVNLDDGLKTKSFSFTFTTEQDPNGDDDDDSGSSGGGGGGFLPPMPPAEPEEETNHPPETPLPPHGFAYVEPGIEQIYTASSWDQDNDQIRLQVKWGEEHSQWSDYVSNNESVEFANIFDNKEEHLIYVRAQDEHGLNSSWSAPYQVFVSMVNDSNPEETTSITAKVDNQTGETQFSVNSSEPLSAHVSMRWDFGDGTILEGSSPSHHYTQAGTYTVTVTMTDESGNVTMKTYTVTIPEPQQSIDPFVEETTQGKDVSSFPWIFVLGGIIASIAAVFVVLRYFEYL